VKRQFDILVHFLWSPADLYDYSTCAQNSELDTPSYLRWPPLILSRQLTDVCIYGRIGL